MGRFAIRHLIRYILAAYVIGYGIMFIDSSWFSLLTLEPALILQGQVWRLLSWVLIPPAGLSIFLIFMFFLYFMIGTTMERTWGTFRFNLYIFSGIIFTVIGAFALHLIAHVTFGSDVPIGWISGWFSTSYINMSMFLAFAATYPNMQLYVMLVLPVKIKWLGFLSGGLLVYDFIMGNTVTRVAIAASMLNFLIFFIAYLRNKKPYNARRHVNPLAPPPNPHTETGEPMKKSGIFGRDSKKPIHRCAICGKTEQDDPDLEFRYCSKCDGNYEYCQEHLFTHTHKSK